MKTERNESLPVPHLVLALIALVSAGSAMACLIYWLGEDTRENWNLFMASLVVLVVTAGLYGLHWALSRNIKNSSRISAWIIFLMIASLSFYSPLPKEHVWMVVIMYPVLVSVLLNMKPYLRSCALFSVYFLAFNLYDASYGTLIAEEAVRQAVTRVLFASGMMGLGSIIVYAFMQRASRQEAEFLAQQKQQVIHLLQCFIPVGERKTQTSRKEITEMSILLKELAQRHGGIAAEDWEIDLLSLLHFVSRVKLPDYMFEKEGKLSEFEFEVVQEHCYMAKELCEDIPDFHHVQTVFLHHHEKVDGTGYPYQLTGDQIPVLSQMLGLVEVFLAMITPRSYRQAISEEDAYREIEKLKGSSFRVDVVDTFGLLLRERARMAERA
ncbi:HD-GYP domain-containing protein [Paenibacillus gansuensis]|uniref:HD-GYP domain-containing protein n=1 Tax=Paenibacillus gansuensis TaxID=306542 RepID=A0ABW5PLC5_9BACL